MRLPRPAGAATRGPTSCTPRSTSSSCARPGTPPSCDATIDTCLATTAVVGAPTTWVLSNHDVTRHATRYARLDSTGGGVSAEARVGPDTPDRPRARPAAGSRRDPAHARAARLGVPLPGRGARPAGGRRPARGRARRPDLGALRPPRPGPGRLPGADPVDAGRPVARASGSGAPWLPQPPTWAGLSVEAQHGVEGSIARALPGSAELCAAPTPRSAGAGCAGSTRRPRRWRSSGGDGARVRRGRLPGQPGHLRPSPCRRTATSCSPAAR